MIHELTSLFALDRVYGEEFEFVWEKWGIPIYLNF